MATLDDPNEKLALACGYVSMACWFVVFTPQIYENYSRKNTHGLSKRFLLLWLLGDIFNLLGVVLQDLLVTMLLIALYYLFSDGVLLGQVFYYGHKYPQPDKDLRGDEERPLLEDTQDTRTTAPLSGSSSNTDTIVRVFMVFSAISILGLFMAAGYYFFGPGSDIDYSQWHLLPQLLGWASALLYCISRIPQIAHNFANESVEGLSIFLFLFSVLGNSTYCISIFLKSLDRTYLLINFPWLLGSGGTLFFDFTIFFQFYVYRKGAGKMRAKSVSTT